MLLTAWKQKERNRKKKNIVIIFRGFVTPVQILAVNYVVFAYKMPLT